MFIYLSLIGSGSSPTWIWERVMHSRVFLGTCSNFSWPKPSGSIQLICAFNCWQLVDYLSFNILLYPYACSPCEFAISMLNSIVEFHGTFAGRGSNTLIINVYRHGDLPPPMFSLFVFLFYDKLWPTEDVVSLLSQVQIFIKRFLYSLLHWDLDLKCSVDFDFRPIW